MRYEWDENKRIANLAKHSIEFQDAIAVFDQFTYTVIDDRFDYGETRYLSFGLLFGEVVVVSHTEDDFVIRIISVRKAEKHEQDKYYKNVRD